MSKLLFIAETACMGVAAWLMRPIERVAPRSGIWIDRWNGRLHLKYELLMGPCSHRPPTKESHGQS